MANTTGEIDSEVRKAGGGSIIMEGFGLYNIYFRRCLSGENGTWGLYTHESNNIRNIDVHVNGDSVRRDCN